MSYTVQGGDSLWTIAQRELRDSSRWGEIARLNHLRQPDRLLIGQTLYMPIQSVGNVATAAGVGHRSHEAGVAGTFEKKNAVLPARAYLFILADEVNPLRAKVVRKVVFPTATLTPEEIERIIKPEKYGFTARVPGSKVGAGLHVLGRTDSRFISASTLPQGSPRFAGDKYWIDVAKAQASGVQIHDGAEIARELDKLKAKRKKPAELAKIEEIRQKSLGIDKEVLLEGPVPAGAVKGGLSMGMTRGLQVVEGVGIVMTAYDLSKAGHESYQQRSVVPLAQESVRQVGGWAGAWAGAETFGAIGALVGVESGPGAIVTGAIGAFIGGVGGFMGADWCAKKIKKH